MAAGRVRSVRRLLLQYGPFLRPEQFAEFITPYLGSLCRPIAAGFYDQTHRRQHHAYRRPTVGCQAARCIRSIRRAVDMAEMKRQYGDQVCLIGNVNCGLLDTGSDEEVVESARYALRHGMPGGAISSPRAIAFIRACVWRAMS